MAVEAIVDVGLPVPEDYPNDFYDDATDYSVGVDAFTDQLGFATPVTATEVPTAEEEEFTRDQLRDALNYAYSIGDTATAESLAAELEKPLGIAEVPALLGGMADVMGDSFDQIAGASLSSEEAINLGLQGKGLPGQKKVQMEKEKVLRGLFEKHGYLPSTVLNTPFGEYTVEDIVDSGMGFGPSISFTGLGILSAFGGPIGLAIGGSTVISGVYNLSVNSSINELAQVLIEEGYSEAKAREAIDSVMTELRLAGGVEAGIELVGSTGLGTIYKQALKKTVGEAADNLVKKVMQKFTRGTKRFGQFVAEETGEEVVSGLYAGEKKLEVEEKLGLEEGRIGGAEASLARAGEIAKESLPAVLTSGAVTTTVVGGGAQVVDTTKAVMGKAKPLQSEKSKVKTSMDFVADNAARKSVSVLDPFTDLPAGKQLRDLLEHREFGDQPGDVKPRDFFETKLNELGDLYHGVDNAINRLRDDITGRFITDKVREQLNSFVDKPPRLSKKLDTAVKAARAGNFTQLTSLKGNERKIAETAYAANEIRETVREIEYRFSQLGIRPAYSKGKSGVPLFFDTKYIKKNSNEFDTWLQQDGYARNAVHAQEIREGILETGGVPYIRKPKAYQRYQKPKGQETPGVVSKKFKADTVPTQFKNSKIEQALPQFAMKAATTIAHGKQFGKNGEKITKLVNDMINQARAQGRIVPKRVVDQVYDIEAALVGQLNPIRTEGLAAANKAATVIQAASTLGGATLSSLGEPLVIFERAGVLPALRAIPDAMNQAIRGTLRTINKKYIKQGNIMRVAEELGVAQEYANAEILTQTFSAEHASALDAFFKSPFGLFLYQWTRWVRAWATGAGMFKFNQYQRELNSGKLSQMSKEQLADLGISEQDFRALNAVFTQAGTTFRDVLMQNATQPNAVSESLLNTPMPSGLTARELLRTGLLRMVNESVMAPRATIRPMWLNDPHFALLGQLKSFPITFGNTVVKRMLRKLDPRKIGCTGGLAQAMGTLAVAGGLVAVAYNAQVLKHGLWGNEENDPKYKPTVGEAETPREALSTRFAEAVQTSGLLGAWQFAIDMFRFNPETTLGPTINDISKMLGAAFEYGEGNLDNADIMEALGQRTGKALGVFGKAKETQEAVGEFFSEMVD